jgi:hypothetical protein
LDQVRGNVKLADGSKILGSLSQSKGKISIGQMKYLFSLGKFLDVHGRHFPREDEEAEVGRKYIQQDLQEAESLGSDGESVQAVQNYLDRGGGEFQKRGEPVPVKWRFLSRTQGNRGIRQGRSKVLP